MFEAYIIQNPESAAAREAGVTASDVLTSEQAAQRAQAAERHLESEVIYVEYTGTFGGDEAVAVLEAIADAISWPRVWYGGGLSSREDVTTVLDAGADAVIVGNVFHDIAVEEQEVCRAAADELANDLEVGAISEWVDASVNVESSSVHRYLSTIPSVSALESLTTQYIEATVRTKLGLERLLGDARGKIEDPDTLKRFADRNAGPTHRWLALSSQQPPAGGDRFLEGLTIGYLGRDLGIETVVFPVDHLGALGHH